jgi:hypothetical protein
MKRAWIPVTLFLIVSSGGCLPGACAETAAARGAATALVDDAQTALSQAQLVIARLENEETRAKAWDALQVAHAALRAAEAQLHAVQGACTAPDLSTVFAEFVRAWQFLAPFLMLLGGDGESRIAAPMVVTR